MSIFSSLLGGLAENMFRGWIAKALSKFVAEHKLTQAQANEIADATILEITLGLEAYNEAQAKPKAAA